MKVLNEIITACKNNEPWARKELFNRYVKVLLGVSCRYLKDRDDAEDVVQDAFIKIFMNIKQYDGRGDFEGWMKRITANTAIQFLKAKQKLKFEPITDYNQSVDEAEENIAGDITPEFLLLCINELPLGYKTILNLFLVEGYSHKEIAEKLEIKESTSRSQYTRARRNLLELIKERKQNTLWKTVGIMMSLLGISLTLIRLSLAN